MSAAPRPPRRPDSSPHRIALLLVAVLTPAADGSGQQAAQDPIGAVAASLRLREVGPAVMGGRISDIAVHPTDRSTWYVAAGSGGLWKTTNAGITWSAIFDDQPSYSIGAVALDPSNPDVVWVGTGENVSGRHVGWGDGVYRSRDGGRSWMRVGLPRSEHIGKILVDPRDGDVILVAAEGPLWSSGGDRGVYRSVDGGDTWTPVLTIDPETGVTDLEFDPSNPDVVYAAAYQRRRHIWSLLAGGPGSGIYKSADNGLTWRRVHHGLPSGDMGKIGLAVTPADPKLVYATIEAHDDERGFYRSRDRGESWERRNAYISGGTGPHYYQEIEASPHDPQLVYQMDVFFHVTRNGGADFDYLGSGREKHSDNHALWIDPDDGEHLIAGTDAGLYESFDQGATWRHVPNLPISQFYKLALDHAEPFFNILGGAQDLGTLWGPSRTTNIEGVRNRDWYAPMGADGYAVAIDPDDSDRLYLQTQQGNLYRYDRRSEEALDIQPQPGPQDPPERWNWDSPVIISPHASTRLYFASQRLWRSDDRGDSWTPISGDLTGGRNRYEMEVLGRTWSVDALWGNTAMSLYATSTAIAESPVAEGVLYVGTDDGRIQVTEDGGTTWRLARTLPGVPELSFINDVEASRYEAGTVFAIADAHKVGDFSPYVFASRDGGRTWESIAGDLPRGTIAWSIEQDHVNPALLFLGAEHGLYVSVNGGGNWLKLGGAPTIPFRDIELQRRDDDLVGASFGRGFYVLDDYSPLREIAGTDLSTPTLFPIRDAWWYVPYTPMQARGKPTLGSTDYTAPNPPFGATITYRLPEIPPTLAAARRESERRLREAGADVPFPGWDTLQQESLDRGPEVMILITDDRGEPVRRIEGPAQPGLHRVAWDLRGPPPDPVEFSEPGFTPPWVQAPQGPLVAPGRYHAQVMLLAPEGFQPLTEARAFSVKPVPSTPATTDFAAVARFQWRTSDLMRRVAALDRELDGTGDQIRHIRAALVQTPRADSSIPAQLHELDRALAALRTRVGGDRIREQRNEAATPSIRARVARVANGHWNTRQAPTATQRRNLSIAEEALSAVQTEFRVQVLDPLTDLERALDDAGAPWTPGRRIRMP